MPTYQYACTECGHQLEAVQSFTDAALVDCPECSGRLRKLYSAVGIVFKGSGFYRTDSRNGASNGAGTAKSSGAKETSSPAKSSETKSTDTASTKPADSGTSSGASKAAAGAA